MIPYFEWRTIQLGPLTLQVWGLFAAIGVIAGAWFAVRQAKKRGLDAAKFERLVFSVIIWAFIGARLGHIVFYAPAYYFQNPVEILKVFMADFLHSAASSAPPRHSGGRSGR